MKAVVYLGACPEYDPAKISTIINRAMKVINLRKPVRGKVVIKPNLVMAHPKIADECFTRTHR